MFKKIFLTTVLCISFIGCSKQSDYQMAIASAQSREVIISYPDGYWRDIQSLSIKHVENGDNPVEYCPLSTDSDNKDCKQLKLTIPNPNQKELIWSENHLSAKGYSTLSFKSDNKNFSIIFEFSFDFCDNNDLLGGSSMYVSAVSSKHSRIERRGHPFNEPFNIDILSLIQ